MEAVAAEAAEEAVADTSAVEVAVAAKTVAEVAEDSKNRMNGRSSEVNVLIVAAGLHAY